MKILLIKISSMGDIIDSTAIIRSMNSLYPDAQIDMVIDPAYLKLVSNLNIVSNFFFFDESTYKNLLSYKKNKFLVFANFFKVLKKIQLEIKKVRMTYYDYVFDLQGIEKSLLFYFLSRGKQKNCKWSLPYKSIYENKHSHAVYALYATVRKCDQFKSIPFSFPFYQPEVSTEELLDLNSKANYDFSAINKNDCINENLNKSNNNKGPGENLKKTSDNIRYIVDNIRYIVISPFTRWETKNYPILYYLIIAVLLANEGYKVFLTGSKGESIKFREQIDVIKNYVFNDFILYDRFYALEILENIDKLQSKNNIQDIGKQKETDKQQDIDKQKETNKTCNSNKLEEILENFNKLQDKKKIIDLIGMISIDQLGYLISKSALFIGGDSLASHLASACNTANIVIFGPTSPLRVGPLNTQNSIIVRNTTIDCLECYQRKCKLKGIENKKCMNSLSPYKIFDLALLLLKKQKIQIQHMNENKNN